MDYKSDVDAGRIKEEESLDYYIDQVSHAKMHIVILCEANLGSYMEIAYDWSWVEAMDMIEILTIKRELQTREEAKMRMQK